MPIYLPHLTGEEQQLLSLHRQEFERTCHTTSKKYRDALTNKSNPLYSKAQYISGYIEAFQDIQAHNRIFDQFELQRVAGHNPDRALGYSRGYREAKTMLAEFEPKVFDHSRFMKGRGFSPTSLLPKSGSGL